MRSPFRHENYAPLGGPDGGNGGAGGDGIITPTPALPVCASSNATGCTGPATAARASGRRRRGSGQHLVLKVPVGTMISSRPTNTAGSLVADLAEAGAEDRRRMGARGAGQRSFATSTNKAPRIAKGERGEEKALVLDLRLIRRRGDHWLSQRG